MLLALRRRLRLPLPLNPHRPRDPGCGQAVDAFGDHAIAHPRTDVWPDWQKSSNERGSAWPGKPSERKDGRPSRATTVWLSHMTAPGVRSYDRRRLDMPAHGRVWGLHGPAVTPRSCHRSPAQDTTTVRGCARRCGAASRGAPQADGLPGPNARQATAPGRARDQASTLWE